MPRSAESPAAERLNASALEPACRSFGGSTLEEAIRNSMASSGIPFTAGETATGAEMGLANPRVTTQKFPFRVLVVDDEFLLRWSIAETLKEHGHAVVEADSGAGALRELKTSAPPVDVVLLDYRLPDTHTLSLLAKIRRMLPATPVILMTAFATPELVAGALQLGAYDVLNKPFDMNELQAVVARACERR
jgi:CheY-like chemotaxis protein